MTAAQWIDRAIRPAVIVGGILPALYLVFGVTGVTPIDLGANPAEKLERFTGTTALVFLLASLAVTPARRLSGVNPLIRLRKPLGLWAFGYALMHLGCYLVFDQSLLWGEIVHDIAKRPYITVGFAAFTILLALALTSSTRAIRAMGTRWNALHRMVYVAATLAVFHYLWLVKLDTRTPALFGAVLVLLLLLRRLPLDSPRRADRVPSPP